MCCSACHCCAMILMVGHSSMPTLQLLNDLLAPHVAIQNKAIVDHTSPALCTPIAPFPADPFCSERVTVRCQWGRKNPQIAPFPWNFVTLPEEDRATAIGNMHRKLDQDRACGSGDILADRQTHRQTCSSQYFATDPAGEAKKKSYQIQ